MEPGALRLPDRPDLETELEEAPAGWPLEGRLAPPAAPAGAIERTRLLLRLRAAETAAVVLAAPAGYGKTVFLARYAASDPRPTAWLTLAPSDDDAGTLVCGVAAALDRSEPIGDALRDALHAGPPALIPRALPRLAATLLAREQPVLLVLDGTEHLRSRLAQDVLRVLIDHVPAGSGLLATARGALPPRTARLRASGRLTVLGRDELRADEDEARRMLEAMGVRPGAPELEAVMRRTEGWPAGIYLAGLALREHPSQPLDDHLHGGEETLSTYFEEEVVGLARRGDAAFLRRASILDRLSAGACDAVLERDDSARVLNRLAEAGMFVSPVAASAGPSGQEYLMHPLFGEALRVRLQRNDPAAVRELHRRAGRWYAEREQLDEAIGHALAAGDTQAAVTLVWLATPAYESRGRSGVLSRWLGLFPERDLVTHPALAMTAAWTRIEVGDGDGARDMVALAERHGGGRALPDGSPLDSMVALTRATLGDGGVGETARLAATSRELDPELRPWTGLSLYLEGACLHLAGDRETARARLEEAERATGPLLATANALALAQLALLALESEDVDAAEGHIRRARMRVDGYGLRDYATQACTFAVSALVAARRGDVSTAGDDARHAAGLLALHQHFAPWLAAETAVSLARAHLRLGDLAAARALASDAQRELRAAPDAVVLRELLEDTWSRIQAGDVVLPLGPSSLTTAERRILQHLPSHMTFKEIGEQLHVSQTTVKTQALAVYRKLDVNSRSDAVRRGQELGLLDA